MEFNPATHQIHLSQCSLFVLDDDGFKIETTMGIGEKETMYVVAWWPKTWNCPRDWMLVLFWLGSYQVHYIWMPVVDFFCWFLLWSSWCYWMVNIYYYSNNLKSLFGLAWLDRMLRRLFLKIQKKKRRKKRLFVCLFKMKKNYIELIDILFDTFRQTRYIVIAISFFRLSHWNRSILI